MRKDFISRLFKLNHNRKKRMFNHLFIQKNNYKYNRARFQMEKHLSFRFLGIGSEAIRARNRTDEGVIHGILLQNKEKELAIFISTIGLKQNEEKTSEVVGVIGGFTLEDLKIQLNKLKAENWTPLGHVQIDIGEKAVDQFLKNSNESFALINLIQGVNTQAKTPETEGLDNKYFSYIL